MLRFYLRTKLWPLLFGLGLLAVALCGPQLSASEIQAEDWVPLNGPYLPGGTVTALALVPSSPDLRYATLGSRVFKSDDAAANWTQVFTATGTLWSLAVDPLSPTVAYAGGTAALYKTGDGGQTWTPVYTIGQDVAVDPITPANVYAVGQVNGDWPGIGMVARSADGGASWTATPLTYTSQLDVIAINPLTPTILYAAGIRDVGKGNIICRSTDGGLSWTAVYSQETGNTGIYDLEIDPQNPQILYASRSHDLLKSSNGGATWVELPGLHSQSPRLALDPQHSETVYAADGWPDLITGDVSLYVSFDGGQSWWQSLFRFPAAVNELIVNPASPNVLYAGLWDYGVYKGSDVPGAGRGAETELLNTWTEVNAGIRTLATVDALAVHPDDPDILLAGSGAGRGGLFESADGGTTWTTVLTDTPIVSLAFNPVTTTMVLAGGPSSLYQSNDGGAHWYGLYAAGSVLSLAFDPVDPRFAYVGGSIENDVPYPGPGQGFVARRVPDAGGWWWYWDTVPITCAAEIAALAVHPITTTTVLAGGVGTCQGKEDAIYRSTDGGLTWTRVLTDIGYGISDVVFSPHSPDTIYASSKMWGVHKSVDGGDTWERKWEGLGVEGNDVLVVDAAGWLYVGTRQGVSWSADGAEHWAPLGSGLEKWVKSLAIQPGEPAHLLAGATSGVWRRQAPPRFASYLPIIARANP